MGLDQSTRILNASRCFASPYRVVKKASFLEYAEESLELTAERLWRGATDLALISLSDLFNYGGFFALPYGVGFKMESSVVFLFAERPFAKLDAILIERDLSVISPLLHHYFISSFPMSKMPKIIEVDYLGVEKEACGGIGCIITGNRAIALQNDFSLKENLARYWSLTIGLPYIAAVWAYRVQASQLSTILQLFEEGIENSAVFARDWAEQLTLSREWHEIYLTGNYFFRLDNLAKESINRFIVEMKSLGIVPFASRPCMDRCDLITPQISIEKPLTKEINNSVGLHRLSVAELSHFIETDNFIELALYNDRQAAISNLFALTVNNPVTPTIRLFDDNRQLIGYEAIIHELEKKEVIAVNPLQASLEGFNEHLLLECIKLLHLLHKHNPLLRLVCINAATIIRATRFFGENLEELLNELYYLGLREIGADKEDEYELSLLMGEPTDKDGYCLLVKYYRMAVKIGLEVEASVYLSSSMDSGEFLSYLKALRQLQGHCGLFSGLKLFLTQGNSSKNFWLELPPERIFTLLTAARAFLDNFPKVLLDDSDFGPIFPAVGQSLCGLAKL